ncbi:hypothetical protein B0A54_03354 [Friedmanniomyces endolithicus]|uniref:Uncharacterized protein n=1 Tax=Friedmanniomyces endolithicus TaxID=329885 RepID=A0A4U0V884_9PEZI|nr:hypothetical protein B0A54_03354 [Friedmanniomyces endolithicus]
MLRQQPSVTMSLLRARATPMLRTQVQNTARGFRAGGKRMMPMPKEEHAAHTISQRLRSLKKIPPELIPIGVVLFAAVFAAFYSLLRKFWVDKTLRLHRTGPSGGH